MNEATNNLFFDDPSGIFDCDVISQHYIEKILLVWTCQLKFTLI